MAATATGPKNGPRTLDLDILLFGDLVLCEHNLEVPHPRLAERAFVLVPLAEIAPGLREPRSGATVAQLLESLVPDPEGEVHAVVQVESDLWRPDACRTRSGSAESCARRRRRRSRSRLKMQAARRWPAHR